MISSIKVLLSKIGIDWAIAYNLFARVIQALGGVGTVIFIVRYLTKDEQGYYYTFGSLIGIQIFFELGLSTILTQYVAHEIAHLNWSEDRTSTIGDEHYQSRLSSLLHFCIKWYTILSILVFAGLMVAGYCFFGRFHNNLGINWKGPWAILSLTTCLFLVFDPLLAFLEGLGLVKDVAKVRLVQQTTYIACVILLLFTGFKLYSSAVATLAGFLAAFLLVVLSDKYKILLNLWKLKRVSVINYWKEIFPYQWKVALSWISGYFIYQLFNPVIFATDGPIVAGQMGMTLAALAGITSISMSWINTKIPLYSSLISNKKFNELDKIFNKSLFQSLAINFLCLVILFSIVFFLQYYKIPLGSRFLPIIPLTLLGSTTFANQIVFSLATYLRCHKSEPLLLSSIILAILCCLSTVLLGKLYGVYGITIGFTFLVLFVSLPWVYYIFIKKKKIWH